MCNAGCLVLAVAESRTLGRVRHVSLVARIPLPPLGYKLCLTAAGPTYLVRLPYQSTTHVH